MAAELRAYVDRDFRRRLLADAGRIRRGIRRGFRRIAVGIRNNVRAQLRRAFPGSRAVNLIAASDWDEGGDDIGARVYSRWLVKRPRGRIDLLSAYAQGGVVRSRSGRALAIPTDEAPLAHARGGGRAMTPDEMRARGMKVEYLPANARRRSPMIAIRRGSRLVVTHVLVRQFTMRRRIDLARAEGRWVPRLGEILAREINR